MKDKIGINSLYGAFGIGVEQFLKDINFDIGTLPEYWFQNADVELVVKRPKPFLDNTNKPKLKLR
jgi:hypothetical protein